MSVAAVLREPGPQLDLAFSGRDGGSALSRRIVRYPYSLGPLHDRDAEIVTACLQSASGGLYSGESVEGAVSARCGAAVKLVTPAACVVHAARGARPASHMMTLSAETGSLLCYLPRAQVLFPASRYEQRISATIDRDSAILVRDGFVAHRPHGFEGAFASYWSEITLTGPNGRLIVQDRCAVDGADLSAPIAGLNGGFTAFGTVFLFSFAEALSRPLLGDDWVGAGADAYCGASALRRGAGLMVRVAVRDGGALEVALDRVVERILAEALSKRRHSAYEEQL